MLGLIKRLPDHSLLPDHFTEALSLNRMTKSRGWTAGSLAPLRHAGLPLPDSRSRIYTGLKGSVSRRYTSTREEAEQVSRAVLRPSVTQQDLAAFRQLPSAHSKGFYRQTAQQAPLSPRRPTQRGRPRPPQRTAVGGSTRAVD